jgi:radical SAM protein with 4Fe4S-binding SPASM domain
MKLKKLAIKPTLICNQNCKFCASRQELHHLFAKQRTLSLSEWGKILSDANDLGNRKFSISGGEPTIYKNLTDLIKIGKGYKWFVSVNTNGSLITEEYAKRLLEAGLDQVRVSLYSHTPSIHEKMRGNLRLWKRAVNAVRIFSDLRKKYSNFRLETTSLISKDNYKFLPELMKFHYDLGSPRMHLSYLEGDFDKQYLLNEKEIYEFKNEIIPRVISFSNGLERSARKAAISVLENLYTDEIADISDYADGVYRPESRNPSPCKIPTRQAIILANGDVHPCNIVEYSHEPVVGNVFEESFPDIWLGNKWSKFRNEYFNNDLVDYCQLCPMNLHKNFRLRAKGNSKLKQEFSYLLQRMT